MQMQPHYTTTTTTAALRRGRWPTRWPPQPLQPLRKHTSNNASVHRQICSAICDSQQPSSPRLTVGLRFLKLPPPPGAVLLAFLNRTFRAILTTNLPPFSMMFLFEPSPVHRKLANHDMSRCKGAIPASSPERPRLAPRPSEKAPRSLLEQDQTS